MDYKNTTCVSVGIISGLQNKITRIFDGITENEKRNMGIPVDHIVIPKKSEKLV